MHAKQSLSYGTNSTWNGISFFFDDHIPKLEDIQLFRRSILNRFFGNMWLSAEWPVEFASLTPSSAISELYPSHRSHSLES